MLVGCSTDETIYNEIPVNVVSTDTSPFNRKLSLITPSHKSFNNSAKKTLNNITKILRDKASNQKNTGDIHIYDGYIKYLEYENFHTYTFLVADSNYKNKTKNVILRSNTDGSYSAFLTTYSISNEEILAFHNGENINFKNKVSIIPITLNQIQSRASNCFKPVEITSPGTGWTDLAWKEVPCSSLDGGGYGGGTGSNDPYDNDNSQDNPYGNDGYNNSGYDNSGYDNDSYDNSNSGGGSSGFENSSEDFSVGQPIDGASNPFFIEDLIISLNAHLEPNLNDEQIDWLRESPENIDFGVNALEALENGGDVDFENRIFELFAGSKVDCLHDRFNIPANSSVNSNLYSNLLQNFNDNTDNWIFFELGDTGSDWGQTKGFRFNTATNNLADSYKIIISDQLEASGSNLAIMATLVHEVIHAFMFDTLSDAGLITFDDDGAPLMTSTQFNNLNCNNLPETATTNLNAYNTEERFAVMMCSLIENGLASTTDWSHDLFGNTVFSVETYQEQLANFLLENHDWENENSNFKNEMMSYFGQEWKEKTAQAVSWMGLVKTDNYVNLVNSLPGLETLYFDQISRQRLLINDANSNCN